MYFLSGRLKENPDLSIFLNIFLKIKDMIYNLKGMIIIKKVLCKIYKISKYPLCRNG